MIGTYADNKAHASNMDDDAMAKINWRAGFSFCLLVVLLVGTYAYDKAHACNINDDGGYNG